MLEINEDEVLDYLEHHGVKGMRWGVKGAKTSSSGGESRRAKIKKALTSDTAMNAYTATAIIGTIVAIGILKQNKKTKMHHLQTEKMFSKSGERWAKQMQSLHKNVKVSNIPKSPKLKGVTSEAATLKKLKGELGTLYDVANADLKKRDVALQIPYAARTYLKKI